MFMCVCMKALHVPNHITFVASVHSRYVQFLPFIIFIEEVTLRTRFPYPYKAGATVGYGRCSLPLEALFESVPVTMVTTSARQNNFRPQHHLS